MLVMPVGDMRVYCGGSGLREEVDAEYTGQDPPLEHKGSEHKVQA